MRVLITTVVDSQYMAYAPLFVYCVRKAYPEYDVKLVLRDPCPYPLDCETVTLFEDFPRFKYSTISLRFVVPPGVYAGYDYVYITDIDIMIMREHLPLANFHENEMTQTGLCYSNSLRNKDHYLGSQSLSGLHFATREWFDRTEEERGRQYGLHKVGLVGLYREWDGVMLYRMCERSGVGLPGKYKLTKRHHGIHLGNFRLFPDQADKWASRIPMEFRIAWLNLLSQGKFQDLIATCRKDNAMLDTQLQQLQEFCHGA